MRAEERRLTRSHSYMGADIVNVMRRRTSSRSTDTRREQRKPPKRQLNGLDTHFCMGYSGRRKHFLKRKGLLGVEKGNGYGQG